MLSDPSGVSLSLSIPLYLFLSHSLLFPNLFTCQNLFGRAIGPLCLFFSLLPSYFPTFTCLPGLFWKVDRELWAFWRPLCFCLFFNINSHFQRSPVCHVCFGRRQRAVGLLGASLFLSFFLCRSSSLSAVFTCHSSLV